MPTTFRPSLPVSPAVVRDRPVVVLARRRGDEYEVELARHRTWDLAEAVAARIAARELVARLGAACLDSMSGPRDVLAEYNRLAQGEAFIAVVPAYVTDVSDMESLLSQ